MIMGVESILLVLIIQIILYTNSFKAKRFTICVSNKFKKYFGGYYKLFFHFAISVIKKFLLIVTLKIKNIFTNLCLILPMLSQLKFQAVHRI